MGRDTQPMVSVVIVSDYDSSSEPTWEDERRILEALSRQDFSEPIETILVESEQRRGQVPRELGERCPGFRVVYAPGIQSSSLKDFGVGLAAADLVAVFEADCVPEQSWLRVLVDVLQRHPEVSAVSGRTTYGAETMYRRVLTLVDRAFDDLGRPGSSSRVSNNAALYRRELLRTFPYPPAVTPFASARSRLDAIRKAGRVLYFEPGAVVQHAVGGLSFIRDFRRNTGYTDMVRHPDRFARAIPTLLLQRLYQEVGDCFRVGPSYLRWYDWPAVPVMLLVARVFEIPGMLDALRGRQDIPGTAYR